MSQCNGQPSSHHLVHVHKLIVCNHETNLFWSAPFRTFLLVQVIVIVCAMLLLWVTVEEVSSQPHVLNVSLSEGFLPAGE